MANAGAHKRARFPDRFRAFLERVVELATRTPKIDRSLPPEATGIPRMSHEGLAIWNNRHPGEEIGPIEAYVLNFSTTRPHPYKFFSPYTELRGSSSEDVGQSSRDPSPTRYKFDLLWSHAIGNGYSRPAWCEITEAAALLLNVHITEFRNGTEEDQFAHVRNLILQMPKCELYFQLGLKVTITNVGKIYLPVLINDPSGLSDDTSESVRASRTFFPDMARRRPWYYETRPIDIKGKGKEIIREEDHISDSSEDSSEDSTTGLWRNPRLFDIKGKGKGKESVDNYEGPSETRDFVTGAEEEEREGHATEDVDEY